MPNISFCTLKDANINDVIALWKTTFNDDENFIRSSFRDFSGFNNVHLACSNGKTIAMLNAVPCFALSNPAIKGIYLFALATYPNMQNQGIMSSLIKYSEQVYSKTNHDFMVLIPANDSLFSFYERFGYNKLIRHKNVNLAIDNINETFAANYINISTTALSSLRSKFLLPNTEIVVFSQNQQNGITQDLAEDGYSIAYNEHAYAVFKVFAEKIFIPEMFANNQAAAERLLTALRQKTNCAEFVITIAENSNIFAEKNVFKSFALYKEISKNSLYNGHKHLYFRFAFEELYT